MFNGEMTHIPSNGQVKKKTLGRSKEKTHEKIGLEQKGGKSNLVKQTFASQRWLTKLKRGGGAKLEQKA